MIYHLDGFTVVYHTAPAWHFRSSTLMSPAKLTRYMKIVRVEIHEATDQDELEARR